MKPSGNLNEIDTLEDQEALSEQLANFEDLSDIELQAALKALSNGEFRAIYRQWAREKREGGRA